MQRPVIILGGGFIGGLLAYRLKLALPGLNFKLYQGASTLGEFERCSFSQSDCEASMGWLTPLISKSWDQYQVKFPKFQKVFINPYHLLDAPNFHKKVYESLGSGIVRLNNPIDLETALREGSFVIDTRNICHHKKKGFGKYLTLEIDLSDEHNLVAPVLIDGGVDKKEHSRSISYMPLSSRRIYLKDIWYSKNSKIELNDMRRILNQTIKDLGWKITRVVREDSGIIDVPLSAPIIVEENRVINLAGLFSDSIGSSIPLELKLIEQIVSKSLRYGETKEIVSNFRKIHEKDQEFFRFLNHLIIEDKTQVLESIYQQPTSVMERFSRRELNIFDKSRIIFGKSKNQLKNLLNATLPYPFLKQ